ncbi:MAG TPA: T9SS type A sorting domain-containing protein [Bacteroidia bacterium]|nr:T9SS type A sorting domain-containing protein [Bacteroidia bacterium]
MNKTLPFGLFIKVAFLFFLFISFGLNAQNIVWQKTIGGSQSELASCAKPTSDGGFILGGYSNSNISGDKTENCIGSWDYWIVKLDAAGNIQWDNTIGGNNDDRVYDIIEAYDGGFLVGGTSKSDSTGDKTEHGCNPYYNYGDYWVVKINSSGVIEWQNTIGACGADNLYSMDHSSNGGYLLGGISSSNISCDKTENNNAGYNGGGLPGCGGGTSDYWIVKIDSIGNIICQKTLGRGSWASEFLTTVSTTSDGGFIVSGGSSAPAYITPNYGGSDFWIVKLNSTCTIEWQKVIGGSGTEETGTIKQLADRNYIFGGTSSSDTSGLKTEPSFGLSDFWIFKLDTVGNIIWQKTIGGSGDDKLSYISPTFDNGFICGGYSTSPISGLKTSANFGQSDYWILKLDSVGNIQWQRTIGGTGIDGLTTISQMADGNYFGGGYSTSNISGNKTENSKGGYDYWVFKLDDASNYNLITGKSFYDYNGNNVKDSSDIYLPYQIIKETNTNRFAFSQADGTYRLPVSDTGTYTVSQIQNLYYLSSFPSTHSATFTSMNQIDSLNDFATTQTIFINDLQISITPVGAFRPGFNATYNIHYKNVGTVPLQGTIVFYPDSGLTYISSTVSPLSVSTDSIVWQTQILNPFIQGNITVTVNVKSTTPIGYWISSSIKIEPVMNDQNPTDNYASWRHPLTGSVDPNDILVDKDSITTEELMTSPYLDYIIRFQNTGNDTAFSVKILNPIDTFKLDLMSLEIISSSHIFNLNYIQEENLEFKFEDILLPDSNINEPESHGFVRYRIKPKTSLVVHDSVTNYAAIYFDHNLPVITNTALTRIVYPNNFVEMFTTVCDSLISPSGNYTWYSTGLYFDTIPGGATDTIYVINLNVGTSYSYLNAVSCENYTSPSGNYTWTSSGTYSDTLLNVEGCDSVITINLTINYSSISPLFIIECISYQSPSGNYTWTTSGTYYDTIPNVQGCDSILIIDLTINDPSDSNITISACNNYISPSGNYLWNTSGIYTDTIANMFGCDSLITINLTVNQSSNSLLSITECDSYTSPSNNYVWTTTGTYSDTIPNSMGCDSIITVDLTILNHSNATLNIIECNNYTSPSGNYTWNTSGIYFDTIPNSSGCDSIITINLTINSVDTTFTANPPLLTSNAIGANYQWMYCDSIIIQGEVNQVFLATVNGSYAVIILQNGCIDTSSCYSVFNVGMNEYIYSNDFYIFPNPSSNNLVISFGSMITKGFLMVSNTLGESVYAQNIFKESKKEIKVENISSGIYFLKVFDGEKYFCKKLIVEHD